jgi:hypothetical protein
MKHCEREKKKGMEADKMEDFSMGRVFEPFSFFVIWSSLENYR